MKLTLTVFVILALSVSFAEEIETRKKTVKKAAAVETKLEMEARTDNPEAMTIIVETILDTTVAPIITKAPEATTTAPPATSSKAPATTTTTTVPEITTEKLAPTTEKVEDAPLTTVAPAVAPTVAHETSSSIITVEGPISESAEDDDSFDLNQIIQPSETPKRKVIYVNQQQSGKLNVHLELSDVSVIVVPSQKDPSQLSLLSLLFKSAQKSKMHSDAKKKEEIVSSSEVHDDYSKYKKPAARPSEETYLGATGIPYVESRAPYKVDISSTMGQQSLTRPAIDITPNAHQHSKPSAVPQFQPQFARSPIMQLLKPIPFTIQTAPGQVPHTNRIFKRSIDSRLLGLEAEIPHDNENSVNEDGLTESFLNSLDNGDYLDNYDTNNDSEFILLGATENCGPGRKRNSYQICVSVANME